MAKFMLNICYGNKEGSEHPEDNDFIMKKYSEWSELMGPFIRSAHKLFDGEGTIVMKKQNKIVEGPYTETKESIGGFYIIEVESIAEATKLAHMCPTVVYQGGYIEVRPVEF
jgi:hypothetical protein